MSEIKKYFRRDRFNQHFVSIETGAVCDLDDVARILEIKRLATLPPPERKTVVRRLKEWVDESL